MAEKFVDDQAEMRPSLSIGDDHHAFTGPSFLFRREQSAQQNEWHEFAAQLKHAAYRSNC